MGDQIRRPALLADGRAELFTPWGEGVRSPIDGKPKLVVFLLSMDGGASDTATGGFRTHRDPDHEMEIDLFRDDGLVHDVTSAVAFAEDTLWVGTYGGGLSVFDPEAAADKETNP